MKNTPARNRKLAAVHVLKKNLALDDTAYRDIIESVTGKRSAAACSDIELKTLLSRLHAVGRRRSPKLPVRPEERGNLCSEAQRSYIKGLWALASREKTDSSLRAMIKRIAGVDDLRFLDASGARKVILALRDIALKAGFNPDHPAKRKESRHGRV